MRRQGLVLVGLGGAVGTALRATLETVLPFGSWPLTTFCINVSGAFVLAVLLETLSALGPDEGWLRRIRLGAGTGVLGGYTTYSSFMVEAARLGESGHRLVALGYVSASVVLGLAAAWAGMTAVSAVHELRGRR